MLANDLEYILFLLRTSFGQQCEAKKYDETEAVVRTILNSGILLTVYKNLPTELQEKLHNTYAAAIKQAILQEHEGEQAMKALSKEGIDCIALKGWEMRNYYPDPLMRQMADVDILAHPYEFQRIKQVMEERGFKSGTESPWKHDNFYKNEVHIEMHKRLTDDSNVIQTWENGLWDRAVREEGEVFKMSPEDYYIFHFVHLHKDFMNGHLGLRRIVDTWLLKQHSVDMKIVKKYLDSFGMWKFHERMAELSGVLMGEIPMDEDSEVLLTHAFTHGIYGSGKSYKSARIAAMGNTVINGKWKSAFNAIFLPFKRMKAQFPVLEKWPVLLPWFWYKRIIRFLKGDTRKYKKRLNYKDITKEDYKYMKRYFEAGGVAQKTK